MGGDRAAGPDGEIALTTQVRPDARDAWSLAALSSVRVEPGRDGQRLAGSTTGEPQLALRIGKDEALCEEIDSSPEGLSGRYRLRALAFQTGMIPRTFVAAADGARAETRLRVRGQRPDPMKRGDAIAGAEVRSGPRSLARWLDSHHD